LQETHSLYGGEILLEYSPGNHQYHAVIKGRKYKVPSVTTALDALAKPALVPWAVNQTIAFIRPAIEPGVEHAESYLEEVYAQAKREFRKVKQSAADIGTQAHNVLEQYVDSHSQVSDALDLRVANCVRAGIDWINAHEVTWLYRERPIYSRRFRYSGRLDGVARVDGVLSVVDWKSSNRIYPEYRLQTAAYSHAIEEEFPELQIEQRILIRLGKEDGVFEPHVYPRKSLRKDFAAFLAALKIYQRMREIEKEESPRHKSPKPEV
jgi:hypothetical protein